MEKDYIFKIKKNNLNEIKQKIDDLKTISVFSKGVKKDIYLLFENLVEYFNYKKSEEININKKEIKSILLNEPNGDVEIAVYGGNFLVYDEDIKNNYLTNTEKKQYINYYKNGKSFLDLHVKAIKSAYQRLIYICLLYTSPSPRDRQKSRMPSSA